MHSCNSIQVILWHYNQQFYKSINLSSTLLGCFRQIVETKHLWMPKERVWLLNCIIMWLVVGYLWPNKKHNSYCMTITVLHVGYTIFQQLLSRIGHPERQFMKPFHQCLLPLNVTQVSRAGGRHYVTGDPLLSKGNRRVTETSADSLIAWGKGNFLTR